MKRVGIIMDDELHKQLKHMAVNEGRTVTDIIVELVKAEVKQKKSSHGKFGDRRDCSKIEPVNPGITLYCKGFRQKLQGGNCNAEFNDF